MKSYPFKVIHQAFREMVGDGDTLYKFSLYDHIKKQPIILKGHPRHIERVEWSDWDKISVAYHALQNHDFIDSISLTQFLNGFSSKKSDDRKEIINIVLSDSSALKKLFRFIDNRLGKSFAQTGNYIWFDRLIHLKGPSYGGKKRGEVKGWGKRINVTNIRWIDNPLNPDIFEKYCQKYQKKLTAFSYELEEA